MNREIKFRAWDKVLKTFHYNVESIEKWEFEDSILNCLNDILNYHGLIVNQYTGLKDKNGKEIWEGDIIRGKRKNYTMNVDGWGKELPRSKHEKESEPKDVKDMYIVKFDNAEFYLERNPIKGRFGFKHNDTIEVIGNIYENPELVESN